MTEALAQTVLQMGMTNYQPLRSYAVMCYAFYKLRTFPLRTSVMQILLRVLYVGRYAVYAAPF